MKINLLSMAELDQLVRATDTEQHFRARALKELSTRERKLGWDLTPSASRGIFEYATYATGGPV